MLENIQKLEDGRERWETGQRGQSKTLPDIVSLFEMGVIWLAASTDVLLGQIPLHDGGVTAWNFKSRKSKN